MFSDVKKYKLDYSLLAVIASCFAFLFLAKRNEPRYLLALTLAFSLAYILWGVWHHHRTHSLTGKVMLEYCLVAGFALVVVSTLLL